MILGISAASIVKNEHATIHQLLDGGLDLFHIRKYHYTDEALKVFLDGIHPKFRHKLVLHSHFHLAKDFGIGRLHFNEKMRREHQSLFEEEVVFSTSVHQIKEFNQLSNDWKYAFLSPVFPSISKKGYGIDKNIFDEIKNRTNTAVQLIGLGGVQQDNYKELRNQGADGAALLGSIWQHPHPLKTIKKCQQIDQLF